MQLPAGAPTARAITMSHDQEAGAASGKSRRLKLQTAEFDFAVQTKTANCEIRLMRLEVARSAHGFLKGFAVERPEEATPLGKLHFF